MRPWSFGKGFGCTLSVGYSLGMATALGRRSVLRENAADGGGLTRLGPIVHDGSEINFCRAHFRAALVRSPLANSLGRVRHLDCGFGGNGLVELEEERARAQMANLLVDEVGLR